MAIQNRRGTSKDFDASKMLPGELAVTTDGSRKVYVAFQAGDTKELVSKEEVQGIVDNTLTVSGKAADAAVVGKKVTELNEKLVQETGKLSSENAELKGDLGIQKIPPAKLSTSKITDNIYSKYDDGWTQDKTDKWKIFNFYNVLANTKIYFGGILDQDFRGITNANMTLKIEEYNSSDEKVVEHSYPVLSSLWQVMSFTSDSNTTKIKVILNANSASFDYTIEMLKKYNNKLYVGYTPISAIDMYYPKYLMYSQEELEKKFEGTNQKIKEIERHIFYVGSTRLYTKIKDAIAEAVKYMDSIVYVDSGTYDLISEFGDDYFSGITGDSTSLGIILKNRVKVIFSSNSKVTCHYKGTNKNVCMYFQCFRPSTYGGSLVNLNLEASRIRYPIHDERIQNTDQYINEYINCDIEFDNTKNEYWSAKQCIGGGLGTNGQITIKNCSFNTKFSETPSSPYGVVSYHNTGASSGKSKIDVDGCYFGDKQTFRLSYYGSSKDISVAKVHGCLLGAEPLKLAETASSTVDNVEVKSYCNEIRGIIGKNRC